MMRAETAVRLLLIASAALALCACSNGGHLEAGGCVSSSENGSVIFRDGFDRNTPEPQWIVTGPSAAIDGDVGCAAPALKLSGSDQPGSAMTSSSFASLGRTFAIDMTLDPQAGDNATSTFTVIQNADQPDSSFARFIISQTDISVETRGQSSGATVVGSGGGGVINRGQIYHVTFTIDSSGFGQMFGYDGHDGIGGGSGGYESAGDMIMKVSSNAGWFDNVTVTEP